MQLALLPLADAHCLNSSLVTAGTGTCTWFPPRVMHAMKAFLYGRSAKHENLLCDTVCPAASATLVPHLSTLCLWLRKLVTMYACHDHPHKWQLYTFTCHV